MNLGSSGVLGPCSSGHRLFRWWVSVTTKLVNVVVSLAVQICSPYSHRRLFWCCPVYHRSSRCWRIFAKARFCSLSRSIDHFGVALLHPSKYPMPTGFWHLSFSSLCLHHRLFWCYPLHPPNQLVLPGELCYTSVHRLFQCCVLATTEIVDATVFGVVTFRFVSSASLLGS